MIQWRRALVTGASSGIGEGFADELGAMGVDLVLVGRDLDSLNRVADRNRARGVTVDVLQADLSAESELGRVVAMIDDGEPMIDLLVNNAGLGQMGPFLELPLDGAVETMRVNNEALVRLTHAAALRMANAGAGTIIQISSMASAQPGPNQSVYAATKAFVSSFGQALAEELAGTGVTCTTVLPGYTKTRYFERVGAPMDEPRRWMSAAEVARHSLEAARQGATLAIPGPRDRVRVQLSTPFPSLLWGQAKYRSWWLGHRVTQSGKRLIPGHGRRTAPPAPAETPD